MKPNTRAISAILLAPTCVYAEVVAGNWEEAELVADSLVQAEHWGTLFLLLLLLLISKRILGKAYPDADPKLASAPVALFSCGILLFHAIRASSLNLWFAFHTFPVNFWPEWVQIPFRGGQSSVGALSYFLPFILLHPYVMQTIFRIRKPAVACAPLTIVTFLPAVWLVIGFYAEAMMKMY